MKLAIDINDVLRDFTRNFANVYKMGYDHKFDINELELYTNETSILFPFKTNKEYEKFVYNDYAYDLFGGSPSTGKGLVTHFNEWEGSLESELSEPIDVTIISTMEYGQTIQSTLFFLSKIGSKIRKYDFPSDSSSLWSKYDVIVTANPLILDMKPSDKISVKIDMDYNINSKADYHYLNGIMFFKNFDNTVKIINNYKQKND